MLVDTFLCKFRIVSWNFQGLAGVQTDYIYIYEYIVQQGAELYKFMSYHAMYYFSPFLFCISLVGTAMDLVLFSTTEVYQ